MYLQNSVDEMKERISQLHAIEMSLPGIISYQVVREKNGAMKFTFVSKNVVELTGKTPQEVVDDPSIIYKFLLEEDQKRVSEAEMESEKNLSLFNIEVRSLSANGDLRWLHLKSMPRKLIDGRIIWDGICADITDRKRTELKLAESEKNLRNVLASMADGFYAIDRNYQIIIINENARRAIERSWGKPITIGMNIFEIIPEKDRERLKENFEKVFEGNTIEYDVHQAKEGLHSWISVSIFPIINENGIITGAHITTRDITGRKNAEEKLRISNERFEMIAATTFDAIWEWNLETDQLWANEMHQRLYGLTTSDPVPLVDEWKRRIHPDDREGIESAREKALASDQDAWMAEYRFQNGDNSYRDIYDRTYVIRNAEGKPIRLMGSMMDITERKKAELEVRNSEQRYRLLIDQASDAIMITDLQGNLIEVNSSLCEMLGYKNEELLKMNIRSLIDPLHLKAQPLLFPDLKKGRHMISQRRMVHKNGTIINVEANIKMIPDGRVVAIARDITARIKAEQLLKNSEEKYRTLIEHASDPIMIYSLADGRILEYNNAFMNTTGYNKKDIETLTLADLLFPEDLINQPLGFGKIKKGIVVYDERKAKKKDGSAIPVELTSKLMPNGNVMVIARNATERKRAEEAIRASEETKRLIMNAALDAIILMDSNGFITSWNPKAEKIFGWKENEAIGRLLSELIIPSQYQKRHEEGIQRHLKTGAGVFLDKQVEISAVDKNGREFPVELSIIKITQSQKILFCGFLRDISGRKKAEQQLIESENRLRTIFNTEPECIKLLGPEGELLDMNPAGLAMIEVDDLEKVRGQKVEAIVNSKYRKAFHKLTKDVFAGKTVKLEFEITGLRGTKRWMSTHAVPLRDASGNIISLLSVTRDISERKKVEEELLREKNLSDSIINSLPGIFYLCDESGKFLRWNKNFEAITGYTATDFLQLDLLDFFEGDDKKSVKKKIDEVFKKGMAEAEAYAITKNNIRIPFYFTGWRIIYDGKPCLIGVGIDLTERKKAEQEMLIANERFNLIARATNDFVWDAYLDMNKVWWNDNYYTQLGWINGIETPGGNSWEEHIEEKDRKRVVDRLTHILKNTNDSIWTDEYRFGKADGSYITVYDRGYIMRDEEGKAYRMIGAMTDISEIKKAEDLLKKSYEDIRRLASHLEKVREEERINIAREIHDELGQQLTVLKMDISWLSKNVSLTEQKQITRMNELMKTIDNTIRSVRRISSELRPSVLDDLGLIAAFEWLLKDFEKRSGIKTKFKFDIDNIDLDINTKTALFRVLQESMTNVARHAQASEVIVCLKKTGDNLLTTIKDNGKGFVVSTIGNKKTLGILGIKERIAILQGTYKINSSLGEGTTVEIKVPVSSMSEPK